MPDSGRTACSRALDCLAIGREWLDDHPSAAHHETDVRVPRKTDLTVRSGPAVKYCPHASAMCSYPVHRRCPMTTTTLSQTVTPLTAEQREQFERDGYLVIRRALSPAEVEFYARRAGPGLRRSRSPTATCSPAWRCTRSSAVASCPEAVGLIDHPKHVPAGLVDARLERAHLPLAPRRAPADQATRSRAGSSGTRTAAGRTASWRPTRARGCRSSWPTGCPTSPSRAAATSPSCPAATWPTGSTARRAATWSGPTRRAPSRSAPSPGDAVLLRPPPVAHPHRQLLGRSPARACSSPTRTAGVTAATRTTSCSRATSAKDFSPVQQQLLGAKLAAPGRDPRRPPVGPLPVDHPALRLPEGTRPARLEHATAHPLIAAVDPG